MVQVLNSQKKGNIKDTFIRVKNMGKGSIPLIMIISMKDSLIMMKSQAKDDLTIKKKTIVTLGPLLMDKSKVEVQKKHKHIHMKGFLIGTKSKVMESL